VGEVNTISVITAVHPPSVPYLADAYDALRLQELPEGWAWQWVVQEDGEQRVAQAVLPEDPRISYGSNRASGPGVVRTTALTRATGTLIRNLDADDKLLPGALARDIARLTNDESIGFTTSRCLDLLPDGTVKSWEHADPSDGRIPRNSIKDQWQSDPNWILSVHPVTVCIRRELLLAVGGWMALTTAEDTGMLLAANALADGWFIWEPSILYRKHSAQVTAQEYHNEPIERQARRDLIVSRVEALQLFVSQP